MLVQLTWNVRRLMSGDFFILGGGVVRVREEDEADKYGGEGQGVDEENAYYEGE